MKQFKKCISILLVSLTILCICSFNVFAVEEEETLHMSDFAVLMHRVTGNVQDNFAFTTNTATRGGILFRYWQAVNPAFYASGAKKVMTARKLTGVNPGHKYELDFYTDINVSMRYNISIQISGVEVFNDDFYGQNHIKCSFTMPDNVTDSTSVRINFTVSEDYNYGAGGQGVAYYISENVSFTDVTDNPGWLGKIKKWFQDIGGWFTDLGKSIGLFFENLWKENLKPAFDSIGQSFTDLGDSIKQKFVDLGENIKSFFTTLKNYLLYFQDPVTLNSNGVLVDKYGNPVYTNPFDGPIDKIQDTCDKWILTINDFLNGMEKSRIQVKGYIENGSTLVNGVLKGVPVLNVCLIFAAGFFVIRKVVGR